MGWGTGCFTNGSIISLHAAIRVLQTGVLVSEFLIYEHIMEQHMRFLVLFRQLYLAIH